MSFVSRSAIFLLSLACAAVLQANVAPPGADQVKAELWSYFKNIEKNSPTVLGGLAKSPESMAAIKQRIDTMSDGEVAQFRKMMVEAPDWRVAPEAISTAFPPQMLDHIRNIGSAYNEKLPQAEKMRDEVRMLVRALRLAPEAKLVELGIDRATLGSIETALDNMNALQLAALHRRVTEATDWRQQSAVAI
ncbi:MAG TPA: hypothetical protein VFT12_09500, partial [Thermoanaerobaculia bacterium]|nr:hypothetical protein [Thermoanaerobaculia bacterium]